jgi:hypothetical protein
VRKDSAPSTALYFSQTGDYLAARAVAELAAAVGYALAFFGGEFDVGKKSD